jgi:hypothetical protein
MGARIRSIKPQILENERTAELSHEAWRLFVSMITLADDYGNLHAAPARLVGAVFWGREAEAPIQNLLGELVDAGLVHLYAANGHACAHLLGWREHQRVDKPGKPRVPAPILPSGGGSGERIEETREAPENSRETPATDLDLDLDLEKEEEKEKEEKIAASASPSQHPIGELFPGEAAGTVTRATQDDRHAPLPFKPVEALRAVADASKGRFVATKLDRGQAINAQRVIRAYPDIGDWRLVGEWLGAGGESWKGELDARHLGKNFEAWRAHAAKWRDDGRPPIERRGARASPSRPVGYAPATTTYERSEDLTDAL